MEWSHCAAAQFNLSQSFSGSTTAYFGLTASVFWLNTGYIWVGSDFFRHDGNCFSDNSGLFWRRSLFQFNGVLNWC